MSAPITDEKRLRLTFFEKNVLDPSNREIVGIKTNDSNEEDISGIDIDYKTPFLSSSAYTRAIVEKFIDVEYLGFFTDGNEGQGKLKKIDLETGEPSINYFVSYGGRSANIDTQFDVIINKNKDLQLQLDVVDRVSDESGSPDFTPARPPLSVANIGELRFNPFLRYSIDNIETTFLGGYDEIGSDISQISKANAIPIDKFNGFIQHLKGEKDVFSPNVVFDFNTITSLESLGSSSVYENLIKRVGGFQTPQRDIQNTANSTRRITAGTGWQANPDQVRLNLPIRVPFTSGTLTATVNYNLSYEVWAKDKIFPISLFNRATQLVYPLERDFEVRNVKIEKRGQSAENLTNSFLTSPTRITETTPVGLANVVVYDFSSISSDPADPRFRYSYVAYIPVANFNINSAWDRTEYLNFLVDRMPVGSYNFSGLDFDEVGFFNSFANVSGGGFLIRNAVNLETSSGTHTASSIRAQLLNGLNSTNSGNRADIPFNASLEFVFENFFREKLEEVNVNDTNLLRQIPTATLFSGVNNQGNDLIPYNTDFGVSSPTIESSTNVFIQDGIIKRRHFGYYSKQAIPNFLDNEIPRINSRSRSALISRISAQVGERWYQPPSYGGGSLRLIGTFLGIEDERLRWRDLLGLSSTASQSTIRNFLRRSSENVRILLQSSIDITRESNTERFRRVRELSRIEARAERPTDLIESAEGDFPFIEINDLDITADADGNPDELVLIMSRKSENAPAPSSEFFDAMKIKTLDNKQLYAFNFEDADHRVLDKGIEANPFPNIKVSEYKWDVSMLQTSPIENLDALDVFKLEFAKSGRSRGGSNSVSGLAQKSTIEHIERKEFDEVVNGYRVLDFDFTEDSFTLELEGKVLATEISCVKILSKCGEFRITRDLIPSDAVRTEEIGKTKFVWSGAEYPEFSSLKANKDYMLSIITGASEKSLGFFIPRPLKEEVPAVSLEKDSDNLKLSFTPLGEVFPAGFLSGVSLREEDKSAFTDFFDISELLQSGTDFIAPDALNGKTLTEGDKFLLQLNLNQFNPFEIEFMKTTDIFFDTIVLLNTNLRDTHFLDNKDQELIHPSDIGKRIEVVEDGLRHSVLFLRNPITASTIKLRSFLTDKNEDQRRLGQVYLLKRIGSFSSFPKITPTINRGRSITTDLFNKAFVTTQGESIDYSMEFSPITKEEDLSLANNLFDRKQGVNEFIVWACGGESLSQKVKNAKGFRFVDLIKSLAVNEFESQYQGGRVSSSGVTFDLETREVR